MNTVLRIGLVVVLICFVLIPIQAQDNEKKYEFGSVWVITDIEIKPGHFDNLVNDHLATEYKKYIEEYIKDGKAVSYKILTVDSPRDGEPNLILMVEYPNWAVFDTPQEYWENVAKKVQGSLDEAQSKYIDRGKIRTIRGSKTAIELNFK